MAQLEGQFGFKTESTYGVGVTVDKFHAGYLSGNPVREQEPLVSMGIRAGRRTPTCLQPGAKNVTGTFAFELFPAPFASLLRHMFGSVATTGAGPYTHTATPGSTDDDSFGAQVGIVGTGGVVHPFTYLGAKLPAWTIKVTAGEIALLDLDTVAQDYVTGTALAGASYTEDCPFTFIHGTVSIAGTEISTVKSAELSCTRPLRTEQFAGSALIAEPIETGRTEYAISVETEFEDLTVHDLANTEVAVVLEFDNGTETATITQNAWVMPTTPSVEGVDSLNSFTFDAMSVGTTDAEAITAVLVNSETSST